MGRGSRGPASSPPGFNPSQYPTPNYVRMLYSELNVFLIKDIGIIHEMSIIKELRHILFNYLRVLHRSSNIKSQLNYHFKKFIYNQLKTQRWATTTSTAAPHLNHSMCLTYKHYVTYHRPSTLRSKRSQNTQIGSKKINELCILSSND